MNKFKFVILFSLLTGLFACEKEAIDMDALKYKHFNVKKAKLVSDKGSVLVEYDVLVDTLSFSLLFYPDGFTETAATECEANSGLHSQYVCDYDPDTFFRVRDREFNNIPGSSEFILLENKTNFVDYLSDEEDFPLAIELPCEGDQILKMYMEWK